MIDEEEELEIVESKGIDEGTLEEWVEKGKAFCTEGNFDAAEECLNKAAACGYDSAIKALKDLATKRKEAGKAAFEIRRGVLVKYNGKGGDVVIPDGITYIGENAFSECSGLTSVKIPIGVTQIDKFAFYMCDNLTSVELPSGLKNIESCAFCRCYKLENIIIPDSVKRIVECAFTNCRSLTRITIPDSVCYTARAVFDGCTCLSEITVGSGNTVYHSAGNCIIETKKKSLVVGCGSSVIPADGSVTYIDDHAFGYCSLLESIEIPFGVETIGPNAFTDCSSLASVIIPNSVTKIEIQAFWGCKITSISIPRSVAHIGYGAFGYCESLTSIKFGGTRKEWRRAADKKIFVFGSKTKHICVVHCADGDIR